MEQAQLFVAAKKNGNILLNVGGCGFPQSISPKDLINICVRRVDTRNRSRDTA
jgi:hypothetical protein